MEPIKYLWNQKDDISETLKKCTMTCNASDVMYFVTSGTRNTFNLFNSNGTKTLSIPKSCILSLVEKNVKSRNKSVHS